MGEDGLEADASGCGVHAVMRGDGKGGKAYTYICMYVCMYVYIYIRQTVGGWGRRVVYVFHGVCVC